MFVISSQQGGARTTLTKPEQKPWIMSSRDLEPRQGAPTQTHKDSWGRVGLVGDLRDYRSCFKCNKAYLGLCYLQFTGLQPVFGGYDLQNCK